MIRDRLQTGILPKSGQHIAVRPRSLTPIDIIDLHRALLLCALFIAAGIVVWLINVTELNVDHVSFLGIYAASLALFVFAQTVRIWNFTKLSMLAEIASAIFAISALQFIMSYAFVRHSGGLVDAQLAAIDNAIGFEWLKFYHWIEGIPVLPGILFLAYTSFAQQLMSIPFILMLFGKEARAYRTIIHFLAITTISSAIGGFLPALGSIAYNEKDLSVAALINPHFGLISVSQMIGVQNDPNFVLNFFSLQGIVTFPSVHAASAVLLIWAIWPLRSLRYPVLILNLLMILSALSHGGHYLIDVIAGCSLSVCVIAAGEYLIRRLCRGLEPLQSKAIF